METSLIVNKSTLFLYSMSELECMLPFTQLTDEQQKLSKAEFVLMSLDTDK